MNALEKYSVKKILMEKLAKTIRSLPPASTVRMISEIKPFGKYEKLINPFDFALTRGLLQPGKGAYRVGVRKQLSKNLSGRLSFKSSSEGNKGRRLMAILRGRF